MVDYTGVTVELALLRPTIAPQSGDHTGVIVKQSKTRSHRVSCAFASVFIDSPTLLWTRDNRLRQVAENLGIQASLP
jgi:hypothetical protein